MHLPVSGLRVVLRLADVQAAQRGLARQARAAARTLELMLTARQRTAAWTVAAVVGVAVVGGWILGVETVPNPWVSLRRRSRGTGRRQRVFIDDEGRVELGLPDKYKGIRLEELGQVDREAARVRRRAEAQRRALERRTPATFRNKDIAVRELLEANPDLHDFLQREWGQGSQRYLEWRRRGRRGPKPQLQSFDGRFDAINGTWDLDGPRAVGSWLEAVYESTPVSLRWDDFAERLPVLEEATGLRLQLPRPALERERRREELEQFDEGTELEEAEVFKHARMAAGGADVDDDAVPF